MNPAEVHKKQRKFRLVPFCVALICFLLPFVEVSCQNFRVSCTGVQLAFGSTIQQANPFSGQVEEKKVERQPGITFALLGAAACIGLCFFRGKIGKLVPGIIGLLSLALLFLVQSGLEDSVKQESNGMAAVHVQIGFLGSCLGFLSGTFLSFAQMRRRVGTVVPPVSVLPNWTPPPPPPSWPTPSDTPAFPPPAPPLNLPGSASVPSVAIDLPEGSTLSLPPPRPLLAPPIVPPPTISTAVVPSKPLPIALIISGVVVVAVIGAGYWAWKNYTPGPGKDALRAAIEAKLVQPGRKIADITTEKISSRADQSDGLVGTWTGISPERGHLTYIFHRDGTALFNTDNPMFATVFPHGLTSHFKYKAGSPAGTLDFSQFRERPSDGSLLGIVQFEGENKFRFDAEQNARPANFGRDTVEFTREGSAGESGIAYNFNVIEEVQEPAFRVISVAEFLESRHAQNPFPKLAEIEKNDQAAKLAQLAGIAKIPSSNDFVLIEPAVSAGKKINYQGKLYASKADDRWTIEVTDIESDFHEPANTRPLNSFSGNIVRLDDPKAVQELDNSIETATADEQKLEQAKVSFAQEKVARQDEMLKAALASFHPGTVFVGTSVAPDGRPPFQLYLEVIKVDEFRKTMEVAVRNDGGWSEKRIYSGPYHYDPEKDRFSVRLSSDYTQIVPDAGPYLDWRTTVDMGELIFDGRHLSDSIHGWNYSFERISDSDKPTLMESVDAEYNRFQEGTKPGKVYAVVATISDQGWTETYNFTFTHQDPESHVVEGDLRFPYEGLRRHFRGILLSQKYKGHGNLLKMVSNGPGNATSSDSKSPFAARGILNFNFRPDEQGFKVEEGVWTLVFKPGSPGNEGATVTEPSELERARVSNERPAEISLSPGRVFEGQATASSGGASEKTRLQIQNIDPSSHVVDAIIESVNGQNVRRVLHGLYSPATRRLTLKTEATSAPAASDSSSLVSADNGALRLNLGSVFHRKPAAGWLTADSQDNFIFDVGPSNLQGSETNSGRKLMLTAAE